METNLIELIRQSPLKHLNGRSQNRFVQKIQNHFTENEGQLFVSSFYYYLNYDPDNDFIIDIENIYE